MRRRRMRRHGMSAFEGAPLFLRVPRAGDRSICRGRQTGGNLERDTDASELVCSLCANSVEHSAISANFNKLFTENTTT
jgi:hypothetical protein